MIAAVFLRARPVFLPAVLETAFGDFLGDFGALTFFVLPMTNQTDKKHVTNEEKNDQGRKNCEICRSLDFRISGAIRKARSERISDEIRIMVNQVHYSDFCHLLLSLLSSLSNKW
jgi:hypothetical protein